MSGVSEPLRGVEQARTAILRGELAMYRQLHITQPGHADEVYRDGRVSGDTPFLRFL